MKQLSIITIFLVLSFCCSAQVKKDSITVTHSFVIKLSEAEIRDLYNFILKADNWSDKGRKEYLEALDKKVTSVQDTIKIKR